MNVTVNQNSVDLPDNASVADLVAQLQAKPPFAVAVNMQFVPKASYATHALAQGDSVELISPVTGG
ncbi:sulfur carrier protein ThiS [Diaphorobacter aerolatus]|uniref:Sulfur carrier protein ThiS n=1 Tax=Diaphorobacter aerolatus TaxID=1288495 RepID=A0A7H0GL91_9BURK|nr:sulfur carrier protein ThiS [Diaphorobacter aerolatus]QNP49057.1 sulfur carrier protein ThiS [Diaphorobacter aerolatus]